VQGVECYCSETVAPNTVELISTLGALSPRGGPVQDPVLAIVGYQGFRV